jgi:hypothetical protein
MASLPFVLLGLAAHLPVTLRGGRKLFPLAEKVRRDAKPRFRSQVRRRVLRDATLRVALKTRGA